MRAALSLVCLRLVSTFGGREPLRMRVTPAMSLAPGFLTVRINVESAAENRSLQVVAESPDFYRSSGIHWMASTPRPLAVFEFRDLPTGLYEVTGILVGAHGQRATVSQLAKVQPSPGTLTTLRAPAAEKRVAGQRDWGPGDSGDSNPPQVFPIPNP